MLLFYLQALNPNEVPWQIPETHSYSPGSLCLSANWSFQSWVHQQNITLFFTYWFIRIRSWSDEVIIEHQNVFPGRSLTCYEPRSLPRRMPILVPTVSPDVNHRFCSGHSLRELSHIHIHMLMKWKEWNEIWGRRCSYLPSPYQYLNFIPTGKYLEICHKGKADLDLINYIFSTTDPWWGCVNS